MSAEHKAALAQGRALGRAVKAYLEGLEVTKPKRGRKRTPDSISTRLQRIEDELRTADGIQRLHLIQERMDLNAELAKSDTVVDMKQLEDDFVAVAKEYSASKGISYTAWREAGVSADVLKRAGVPRTRS